MKAATKQVYNILLIFRPIACACGRPFATFQGFTDTMADICSQCRVTSILEGFIKRNFELN